MVFLLRTPARSSSQFIVFLEIDHGAELFDILLIVISYFNQIIYSGYTRIAILYSACGKVLMEILPYPNSSNELFKHIDSDDFCPPIVA